MAEAFFQATAWTMDTPKPYGAFHLVLTVLGVSLSIFLARKFSFPERKAGPDTILFLCGLFLSDTAIPIMFMIPLQKRASVKQSFLHSV